MNKISTKARYGEATRLYEKEAVLEVGACKLELPRKLSNQGYGVYCPYLYYNRTLKSTPNNKNKCKFDRAHDLTGETFNLKTIRDLIMAFDQYLKYWKPGIIAHSAHRDNLEIYEKRLKVYRLGLERLGYEFLFNEKDEWGDDIYYYKRKEGD